MSLLSTDSRRGTVGVFQALAAFMWWGLVTGLYFKSVDHVGSAELLAWRVLAGLPLMIVLTLLGPGIAGIRKALPNRRAAMVLFLSSGLIAVNWLVFIYAVVSERLVEASLGYYINPLVSVLLGRLVLNERLNRRQSIAIGIAGLGVLVFAWSAFHSIRVEDSETLRLIELPWIALALPLSFGLYGLLRKQMPADSITGLTIEMAMLLPFMVALQLVLVAGDHSAFGAFDRKTDVLLVLGGIVTVVPLLFFAAAARRLRLATLGMLQYLAPTCQFLLAVLYFGEPLDDASRIAAFVLIWIAIAVYSIPWPGRRATPSAIDSVGER